MSNKKPKPGELGGRSVQDSAKNTVTTVASQDIVALRGELKQLTIDLKAITAGEAGSTFAKGAKAKLKTRIAALESILAKLEA